MQATTNPRPSMPGWVTDNSSTLINNTLPPNVHASTEVSSTSLVPLGNSAPGSDSASHLSPPARDPSGSINTNVPSQTRQGDKSFSPIILSPDSSTSGVTTPANDTSQLADNFLTAINVDHSADIVQPQGEGSAFPDPAASTAASLSTQTTPQQPTVITSSQRSSASAVPMGANLNASFPLQGGASSAFFVPAEANINHLAQPGIKIYMDRSYANVAITFTPPVGGPLHNTQLPVYQLSALELLWWLSFIVPHEKLAKAGRDLDSLKRQGSKHLITIINYRDKPGQGLLPPAQGQSSTFVAPTNMSQPSKQTGFGHYAQQPNGLGRSRQSSGSTAPSSQSQAHLNSLPTISSSSYTVVPQSAPSSSTSSQNAPPTGNAELPVMSALRAGSTADTRAIGDLLQAVWDKMTSSNEVLLRKFNKTLQQIQSEATVSHNPISHTTNELTKQLVSLRGQLESAQSQVARSNQREAEALNKEQQAQRQLVEERGKSQQFEQLKAERDRILRISEKLTQVNQTHRKEIEVLKGEQRAADTLKDARQATIRNLTAEVNQWKTKANTHSSSSSPTQANLPVFGKVFSLAVPKPPTDATAEVAQLRDQLQKRTDRMREIEQETKQKLDAATADKEKALADLKAQLLSASKKIWSEHQSRIKELEETVAALRSEKRAMTAMAAEEFTKLGKEVEENARLRKEVEELKTDLANEQQKSVKTAHDIEQLRQGFDKITKRVDSLRQVAGMETEESLFQGNPVDRAELASKLFTDLVQRTVVTAKKQASTELIPKFDERRQKIKERDDQVQARTKEIAQRDEQIRHLQSELTSAQQSLTECCQSLDEAQKALEIAQTAQDELREEAQAASQVPIASPSPEKQSHDEDALSALRDQLAARDHELEDIRKSKEELEQSLAESTEARFQAREECRELENERNKFKEEKDKWKDMAMSKQAALNGSRGRVNSPATSSTNGDVKAEPNPRISPPIITTAGPSRPTPRPSPQPAPAATTDTTLAEPRKRANETPLFLPGNDNEQEQDEDWSIVDGPSTRTTTPNQSQRHPPRKRRRIMSEEATNSPLQQIPSVAPSTEANEAFRPVTREWIIDHLGSCVAQRDGVKRCKLCFVEGKKAMTSQDNSVAPDIQDLPPLRNDIGQEELLEHLMAHQKTLRRLKEKRRRDGKEPPTP